MPTPFLSTYAVSTVYEIEPFTDTILIVSVETIRILRVATHTDQMNNLKPGENFQSILLQHNIFCNVCMHIMAGRAALITHITPFIPIVTQNLKIPRTLW